jgi:hypothetical protein
MSRTFQVFRRVPGRLGKDGMDGCALAMRSPQDAEGAVLYICVHEITREGDLWGHSSIAQGGPNTTNPDATTKERRMQLRRLWLGFINDLEGEKRDLEVSPRPIACRWLFRTAPLSHPCCTGAQGGVLPLRSFPTGYCHEPGSRSETEAPHQDALPALPSSKDGFTSS